MKRSVLDDFALEGGLDAAAIASALELSGARPDARAWRQFAFRVTAGAGVASLAAGLIFFVAANWQRFETFGKFALVEAALAACAGVALWRLPPDRVGRAGVFLALIATGALLALFGQTYQTGADVYELFFTWALLALPFALAGRWAATWAAWWVVLNAALALFCGWLGPGHFMWGWLDRWGVGKPAMLMLPFAVNLAGAGIMLYIRRTRFAEHSSRWLVRMLATIAFAYATVACIGAVADRGWWRAAQASGQDGLVVVAFAAVSIALSIATLRQKRDVFPMALILASWIAISTAFLMHAMKLDDIGAFFFLALWLIVSSGVAGMLLMKWVRAWRIDEEAPQVPA